MIRKTVINNITEQVIDYAVLNNKVIKQNVE